jgi:hypothetical protein
VHTIETPLAYGCINENNNMYNVSRSRDFLLDSSPSDFFQLLFPGTAYAGHDFHLGETKWETRIEVTPAADRKAFLATANRTHRLLV